MTKHKTITVLTVFALLFITIACFLIYRYVAPSRGTIYVFNDSYSAGEQVTSEMLTPVQVDSTVIVAGKKDKASTQFVTPSDYVGIIKSGDSLRMDVNKGMPLTTSMLSVAGGSTVEMNMKSDSIAVTVPVDRFTGITNDLKEGARVNVYSSTGSQTSLIQQNKRILAVYSDDGEITGVSIEEDLNESMELIYAATYGKIYLGLVDATGYQSQEGADPVYDPYSGSSLSENLMEYLLPEEKSSPEVTYKETEKTTKQKTTQKSQDETAQPEE